MRSKQVYLWLATLALVAASTSSPQVAAQSGSRYFAETEHTVREPFLSYWNTHGGLTQQGLPLTEVYDERNDADGKSYSTQYFERARFEYHPENADPRYQVLLGLLGKEALRASDPTGDNTNAAQQTVPGSGSRSFAETGKRVDGLFLDYWNTHGGLAQQGFPISGAFYQTNVADGKQYITQYFERARFEYHPEQANPTYKVLLGLVGKEVYQRKGGGASSQPAPGAGSKTYIVSSSIPVPPNSYRPARATCLNENQVAGGGWLANPALKLRLSSSDDHETAWLVGANNDSGVEQTLTAYAVCLREPNALAIQNESSTDLLAGVTGSTVAACANGLYSGGGFQMDGALLSTLAPGSSGRSWQARVKNVGSQPATMAAYVICVTGSSLAASNAVSRAVEVPTGGSATAVAECAGGSTLLSGGFALDAPDSAGDYALYANQPGSSGRGWSAALKNDSGQSLNLTAYAVCGQLVGG